MKRYLTKISCMVFCTLLLYSCSSTEQMTVEVEELLGETSNPPERPIPQEIVPDAEFLEAQDIGTRTNNGSVGTGYWIQSASYTIDAELVPNEKVLFGTTSITYRNQSPDTLNQLYVHLLQNLHKEGAIRTEFSEVTGGMTLSSVLVDGDTLSSAAPNKKGYSENGTVLRINQPQPLAPGSSVSIDIAWSFLIPQQGGSGRMGWSQDNLFYLAYFYPHMAVYDDVIGWHTDQFQGTAELYADFADYTVSITAPGDWVVYGTGTLLNAEENLSSTVYERMIRAHQSDEVVAIITKDEFGSAATTAEPNEKLTWKFQANNVRDVAFSATKESFWDGTRTSVGDIDGDGTTDYTAINAFYRELAPRWKKVAEYSAHSISFLSTYLDFPYPYPHMTAIEGSDIIGGGMEFPMMTIMGDYNQAGDAALYNVTAHELAHMWIPMLVATNERRYAWMDEGATSFNENQARADYFPGQDHEMGERFWYLYVAKANAEGEIMRWSDYHYTGTAYGTASYAKPAQLLVTLRGLLGEDTFIKAYRTFIKRWAYKHPYPWDLWNSFEDVSGKDLDWFWYSWYHTTWKLDHAIASVERTSNGITIEIEDLGNVTMPTLITVTYDDGSTSEHTIEVDHWLSGSRNATLTIEREPSKRAVEVAIDPESLFPDVDASNNFYSFE